MLKFENTRIEALNKGRNLVCSNHVKNMKEIYENKDGVSNITARVIPQTSISKSPYSLFIYFK